MHTFSKESIHIHPRKTAVTQKSVLIRQRKEFVIGAAKEQRLGIERHRRPAEIFGNIGHHQDQEIGISRPLLFRRIFRQVLHPRSQMSQDGPANLLSQPAKEGQSEHRAMGLWEIQSVPQGNYFKRFIPQISQNEELEFARNKCLEKMAILIQKTWRMHLMRQFFVHYRRRVVKAQAQVLKSLGDIDLFRSDVVWLVDCSWHFTTLRSLCR